jgi:hypothetical protein
VEEDLLAEGGVEEVIRIRDPPDVPGSVFGVGNPQPLGALSGRLEESLRGIDAIYPH